MIACTGVEGGIKKLQDALATCEIAPTRPQNSINAVSD